MNTRQSDRLRVLMLAEACNPTWPSVPLVGYSLAKALALRPDLEVTLLTHVRNRVAVESSPLAKLASVHYIDNEFLAAPMYALAKRLRGGQTLAWTIDTAMAWPGYIVFEHLVHKAFGRRLQAGDFDLIHRVTPLTPTVGSPLAAKTDVPMLLGPLNGGLPWPREYPELIRREKEYLTHVRRVYRLLPFFRSTYRHLAGVIAASRATAADIPRWFHKNRYLIPENAIDPERFPPAYTWPEPTGKFRFVSVGRLVPYKGTWLTLEAFRRSPILQQCEFLIVGDGPQRAEYEEFTRKHALTSCVTFVGNVPNQKVTHYLRSSQVFVFPSLREFGGGVVLEAMSSALPSVIVDYGGPAELLETGTGYKLPMQTREPMIEALRAALERCATNPAECRQMGMAATVAVQERHTWAARATALRNVYSDLVPAK